MITAEKIQSELFNSNSILKELVLKTDANKVAQASKDLQNIKSLGFNRIANTDPLKEYETSIQSNENITELKDKYPLIKFITKEALLEVCKKYNLIIGKPAIFTSEIPVKNIKEISEFKMKKEDLEKFDFDEVEFRAVGKWEGRIWGPGEGRLRGGKIELSYNNIKIGSFICKLKNNSIRLNDNLNLSLYFKDIYKKQCVLSLYESRVKDKINYVIKSYNNLFIAATSDNFDMNGKSINSEYYIEESSEPFKLEVIAADPIVFKRTKHDGIYAIVTAWGDEAYDPLMINEIYN